MGRGPGGLPRRPAWMMRWLRRLVILALITIYTSPSKR